MVPFIWLLELELSLESGSSLNDSGEGEMDKDFLHHPNLSLMVSSFILR